MSPKDPFSTCQVHPPSHFPFVGSALKLQGQPQSQLHEMRTFPWRFQLSTMSHLEFQKNARVPTITRRAAAAEVSRPKKGDVCTPLKLCGETMFSTFVARAKTSKRKSPFAPLPAAPGRAGCGRCVSARFPI